MKKNLCTIIFAHPRLLMFCCLHSNVNSFVCFWLNVRMKGGLAFFLKNGQKVQFLIPSSALSACTILDRKRDVSPQNFSTPLFHFNVCCFLERLAQNKITHRDFHSSFCITLLIFIYFFICNVSHQPGYVFYISSRVVPVQWKGKNLTQKSGQ